MTLRTRTRNGRDMKKLKIIKNGQPKNLALHGLKVEIIKNGQQNLPLHGLKM